MPCRSHCDRPRFDRVARGACILRQGHYQNYLDRHYCRNPERGLTQVLVRVRSAHEAALAAAKQVDVIEVAVDAFEPDVVAYRAIRSAFSATLRLRCDDQVTASAVVSVAAAIPGDEIAIPFDHEHIPPLDLVARSGMLVVAVLTAQADFKPMLRHLAERVDTIMLEAAQGARLVDQVGIARLDAFAEACRDAGLRFGFSGGLEAPDVVRLLLLRPDVLGFDAAVRQSHQFDCDLDPHALDTIRALIPRDGGMSRMAYRDLHAVTDRIFVRDFVLPLSIGAYRAERGKHQRVRFGVEARVVREPTAPRDMRDVFSYDVIVETIRVLSQRAHVIFVETLAEEIAASLLAHEALASVSVSVEKLDIVDGTVGIEITRTRPP